MNKANLGAEGLGRSCLFFDASVPNLILPLLQCSVLVQHLVEGVVKLAGDRVDLQLLPDDLVLQLVDPMQQYHKDDIDDCGDGGDLVNPEC